MNDRETAYLRHQQQRWLRPDANNWIRPDATRFLKPGTDPADVFPALAIKRQREEDAEQRRIAADISEARAEVKSFRRQLGAIKQEIARRRAAATASFKYSASQPRIPAGRTGGGRWTDRSSSGGNGGGGIFGGLGGGDGEGGDAGLDLSAYAPMGDIDFGDLTGLGEFDGLFGIAPGENDSGDFTQLAGDVPTGDGPKLPPVEEIPAPPEVPATRPEDRADRMDVIWDLAEWISKVRRIVAIADTVSAITQQADWIKAYGPALQSYADPPRSLEELEQRAQLGSQAGYQKHHIEEQTLLERLGLLRSERNNPSNMVLVPTLKHYDISGWYSQPNDEFGGLSPRDYLRDRDAAERRSVGLYALKKFGVMK